MDKHSHFYIIYIIAGCFILTSCTKPALEDNNFPPPIPVYEVTADSKPLAITPTPTPTPTASPKPSPSPSTKIPTGLDIINEAAKYIGQRETNGKNRSQFIDKINLSANSYLGAPYCASFISYVLKKLNIEAPNTASSVTMVSKNNLPWSSTQQGDVVGLYFPSKERVAHVLFIDNKDYTKTQITTVEANTNPSGSLNAADRDGDGVYRKIRNKTLVSNSRNKYSRYLEPKRN